MQLVLDGIGKKVGAETWLHPMSLDLRSGAVTVLLGATQAGKTSLMRLMAGLDAPTAGRVLVDGRDVTGVPVRHRDVSMVYQQFINYPSMTVARNIASPMRLRRQADVDARVRELAAKLHIEPFLDRLPAELSGGQQQRVACARAIVSRPEIIFGDEPTGNLDSNSSREVLTILRDAVDDIGQTVVIVTHDATAASYADRVVFLADGRVVGEIRNPTPADILARMADIENL